MPYVSDSRKSTIAIPHVSSDGDLNYVITRMAEERLWQRLEYDWDNVNYEDIAAVYGTLQAAAAEYYRRVVVPYEERKMAENGDVFTAPWTQPQLPPGKVIELSKVMNDTELEQTREAFRPKLIQGEAS